MSDCTLVWSENTSVRFICGNPHRHYIARQSEPSIWTLEVEPTQVWSLGTLSMHKATLGSHSVCASRMSALALFEWPAENSMGLYIQNLCQGNGWFDVDKFFSKKLDTVDETRWMPGCVTNRPIYGLSPWRVHFYALWTDFNCWKWFGTKSINSLKHSTVWEVM